MEKFLEAVALAWNPIGEVRSRARSGSLTLASVLVPFVGIVVGCNLFVAGAQRFYIDSLSYAAGGTLQSHPLMASPLMTSDYALRLMAALGVLIPVGAVSMLPTSVFHPAGRSATLAAMLVVAAAWAFYGAALGVPGFFVAGALANVSLELGAIAYFLLTIPMNIAVFGLLVFFWLRIARSVLRLAASRTAAISAVAVAAEAVVVGFLAFVFFASA